MVLPGGMALGERAETVASMAGPPWSSFEFQEPREFILTAGTAVVQYDVIARQADARPYSALMSGVYVRRADGWKLALHQQTPR